MIDKNISEAVLTARDLLKQLNLVIPLDLEKVLKELCIEYVEKPLGKGFDGIFIRNGDSCGIMLNSNIVYEARKRFTIAHEIGHCFIPSHQRINNFECYSDRIGTFNKKKELIEYEADTFAAEFLMPQIIFSKDVYKITPSINSLKSLADKYKTSLTATAIRYIEFTLEPCAIVFMENGIISWYRKSKNFKYSINRHPKECCAYDLIKSGEEFLSDIIYSHYWLNDSNFDYVKEEVVNFSSLKQQIILLKPHNSSFSNNFFDDEEEYDY